MSTTQVERYKFTRKLQDELPQHGHMVVGLAFQLLHHGAYYRQHQEDWCNVEMSKKQTIRREVQEKCLEARIILLCKPLGIEPVFSDDPRGHTIKLKMPSGFTDDLGKEGFCVPTS